MKHKSKYHQFRHLIRLSRRLALAGSETAYRRYIWLCDNQTRLVGAPKHKLDNAGRFQIIKSFRTMGWSI